MDLCQMTSHRIKIMQPSYNVYRICCLRANPSMNRASVHIFASSPFSVHSLVPQKLSLKTRSTMEYVAAENRQKGKLAKTEWLIPLHIFLLLFLSYTLVQTFALLADLTLLNPPFLHLMFFFRSFPSTLEQVFPGEGESSRDPLCKLTPFVES